MCGCFAFLPLEGAAQFLLRLIIAVAHHPRGGFLIVYGLQKRYFCRFAYEFELLRCAKVPIVTAISYH